MSITATIAGTVRERGRLALAALEGKLRTVPAPAPARRDVVHVAVVYEGDGQILMVTTDVDAAARSLEIGDTLVEMDLPVPACP